LFSIQNGSFSEASNPLPVRKSDSPLRKQPSFDHKNAFAPPVYEGNRLKPKAFFQKAMKSAVARLPGWNFTETDFTA
jgi:hypothetical protein